MTDKLHLVFVRLVGIESDDCYIYEFFFAKNTDSFWGDDFGVLPASGVNGLKPYSDAYDVIKRVKTNIKLVTIPESTQFSVQDAIDHCTCLAYEDISSSEYPDFRLVLQFGQDIDEVEHDLALKEFKFES